MSTIWAYLKLIAVGLYGILTGHPVFPGQAPKRKPRSRP